MPQTESTSAPAEKQQTPSPRGPSDLTELRLSRGQRSHRARRTGRTRRTSSLGGRHQRGRRVGRGDRLEPDTFWASTDEDHRRRATRSVARRFGPPRPRAGRELMRRPCRSPCAASPDGLGSTSRRTRPERCSRRAHRQQNRAARARGFVDISRPSLMRPRAGRASAEPDGVSVRAVFKVNLRESGENQHGSRDEPQSLARDENSSSRQRRLLW